jgi:hypothetical protein
VLKITTRCNEDVWTRVLARNKNARPAVNRALSLYLEELCRAHMPVINKLIQGYRVATYDYFAFEVAPWDVPIWHIERDSHALRCILVPYRGWDHRPLSEKSGNRPEFFKLIGGIELRDHFTTEATPGEFELLDALNLIERGDYSGGVRRVTTAVEIVVEAVLERALMAHEGAAAAAKFLKDTRTNFSRRVSKYESLCGRSLSPALQNSLEETRKLRHEIVHKGYRITSAERGRASEAVDTSRWIFNWFENDRKRTDLREKRFYLRSLGRDMYQGILDGHIAPDGVVLTPPIVTASARSKNDKETDL